MPSFNRTAHPGKSPVPYITAWDSEQAIHPRVVTRGAGIGYTDETAYDRDADRILWSRVSSSPGKGRPEFGRVHSLRQRRAMRKLLCQVCGRPADRDESGVLWLLGEDADDLTTTHPPLCMLCAAQSARICPYLRTRYTAVRAQDCTPIGVQGVIYRSGPPFPAPDTHGGVLFGAWRIPWTRATQLIVRLDRCTPVELETPAPAAPR